MLNLRELINCTMWHQVVDPTDPLNLIRTGRILDSVWCDLSRASTKPCSWTWGCYRLSPGITINVRGTN